MIVNYKEEGWSVVMQRSHGLLAGQICGHWRKADQPVRWVETLIATADHDDINDELESAELLTQAGGPRNFKADTFNRQDCERLLRLASEKGSYVALLLCRHIYFLYGGEAAAQTYINDLKQREKEWIAQAQTTDADITESYRLLEFCDAFSLLICQELAQPEQRSTEISTGPGGVHYEMRLGSEGQIIVSPWPFEEDRFPVNYETRTIRQLAFKNERELRSALEAAEVVLKTVIISKN